MTNTNDRIEIHDLKDLQSKAEKIGGLDELIRDLSYNRSLYDFGTTIKVSLGRNLMHHAPRSDRLAADALRGIVDGLIRDRNALADEIGDRVSLPDAPENPYIEGGDHD